MTGKSKEPVGQAEAKKGRIASLFDRTGNMLQPWNASGWECHLYDAQHPPGINVRDDGMITHGVDLSRLPPDVDPEVLGHEPPRNLYQFVTCFPCCKNVARSGARWFKGKGLRALEESVSLFATSAEFVDLFDCEYMIENPMSMMGVYWRNPDHKFHPCHYSGYVGGEDFYTKETWLWTSEGFVMPPRQMFNDLFDEPDAAYVVNMTESDERADTRSITPVGFAIATHEHNEPAALEKANVIVDDIPW